MLRLRSILPQFASDGVKKSDDYKPYRFGSGEIAEARCAAINYFIATGDCFHCGKEFVSTFPGSPKDMPHPIRKALRELAPKLMTALKTTAIRRRAESERTGELEYDEFWPKHAKITLDRADEEIAPYYGFTEEELDFIINYDIKYRMGLSGASGEEE